MLKETKRYLPKFSLENKIALVTGGSRGIGKAIAFGLAEAGANVIVASRKFHHLNAIAKEISSLGRKSLAVVANTGSLEDIRSLVAEGVKTFGRIDILVNNAGTNPVMGPVIDIEEKVWDKIMGVNLKGYFFLSQAVAKIMCEKGGGKIINISSIRGVTPIEGLGVYSISKAGVIMLTKVLALELSRFNIQVNCIAPGFVKTKFSQVFWSNPEALKKQLENIPLKRVAQPEDIVGTAIYLASEASSYTTGEAIFVDGGSII